MARTNFSDLYLVCIHEKLPFFVPGRESKDIITDSAKHYRDFYKIPQDKTFTNRPRDYHLFTKLTATSLAGVSLADKLYLIAHADTKEVGPYKPKELVKHLAGWGLTAAGVVVFKACEVGIKSYLEDFVTACTNNGIQVGWVKGYMGAAATTLGYGSKPRETITVSKKVEVKGHDKRRLRIVQGNATGVTWDHWSFNE